VSDVGLSVRFSLIDQQIVDAHELPIGRVDDIELELRADGPPRVAALLVGAQALGERLRGRSGSLIAAVAARARDDRGGGPARIEAAQIAELEPQVRLSVGLEELRDVAALESWLSHHFVERLPGAGRARR
jgi:hypothetical protein